MLTSPIRRHVGQVFVPVRDMERSARWYGALLGFEPDTASHGGTVLDIPVEEGPRIALDANRTDFTADGPPRFFFWTDDMAATVEHLQRLGVHITSDVEDIGSVLVVHLEDPDGNPLMVCQRTP
ncbi:VOC family protein [Actinopolymorpha alba]|uniref:VOC family protein n=1 Tax=Actinopolymorpha alba TaxID=533267 RepID=UPI000361C88C|nr:VOC family protein [Actinopolymorpha alba]